LLPLDEDSGFLPLGPDFTDASPLPPASDVFAPRHLGPGPADVASMLGLLGFASLDQLIDRAIPAAIRMPGDLDLPAALTESAALDAMAERANKNEVLKSFIGLGYHNTRTPPVILRNILENPGWYTAYTPYQAEISQGRLEALVVFQTMVEELTGLPIAGASLLDEGTAAAEAMTMSLRLSKLKGVSSYFVSELCHPHTIAVVATRAAPLGIEIIVGDHESFDFASTPVFGALIQYPATNGGLFDYEGFCARAKSHKAFVTAATDLLALTLLRPPGEFGADIAVGNTQRFGVPLGFGGPHAAFLSTREKFARKMPGRIIGVSKDRSGKVAYRMALQTREQHIRREKATSNVCTSQVLLAVIAGMYAVWHGPEGLTNLATTVHHRCRQLAVGLADGGYELVAQSWFDTLAVRTGPQTDAIFDGARSAGMNLRRIDATTLGIAIDETTAAADIARLLAVFGCGSEVPDVGAEVIGAHARSSSFLRHEVYSRYRTETEMMRFLHRLEAKDLALNTAMIPLGSCTMKLNAATQMMGIGLQGFNGVHPFVPSDQTKGYARLIGELENWLAEITGYAAVSMQPNAGSQGEYAGLLVISAYHQSRGDAHRNICLIPNTAHGTNPASAVMAGMKVVVVACDDDGNIDLEDLRAKAELHSENLAALMVTYPSTHGVFEELIVECCDVIHANGGQVYLDGANLNAMVGLCQPGQFGADVSHLNLHKTFAIPHGGGGPGMGPIGVGEHLAPFLPGHPIVSTGGTSAIGPISAAPWGSASILPISWAYIAMLGPDGLKASSQIAILNANYIAKRLEPHYPVLYTGKNGLVAHECIVDFRQFKLSAGLEVADIAKRLMDYGFHGPTMSWPVTGTLMIEPTESESKWEIDRFIDALISIREEIRELEDGEADLEDNLLANAPHTSSEVCSDSWAHPYGRERAAFPTPHTREHKFWPSVGRVDDAFGDRNLCTCLPPDAYES